MLNKHGKYRHKIRLTLLGAYGFDRLGIEQNAVEGSI